MNRAQTDTTATESLRYVFIERARCPACGSDDLHTTRVEDQGDGSTARTTNCRRCKHHFFVIVE